MIWGQACWLRLEIPALGRLRRCELEANLGYTTRLGSGERTNSQLPGFLASPCLGAILCSLLGLGDLVVSVGGDVGVTQEEGWRSQD